MKNISVLCKESSYQSGLCEKLIVLFRLKLKEVHSPISKDLKDSGLGDFLHLYYK